MPRIRRPKNKALRWMLIAATAAFLLAVDWVADGVGPRIVFGSATFQVTSTPTGARVLLDGERVGETPLSHDDVRPGRSVVRLEHRFHDAEVRRVQLSRAEEQQLHVDFAPATGALEIVSNPRGAELRVDGVLLEAAAPVVLNDQSTGSYEITATIYGRQTKTLVAEVLPRQRTDVAFELERVPMGEVYLDLTPADARVELLDLEQAYQPGVTLPVGDYQVRVQRNGYASRVVPLRVDYGRNLRAVRLDREYGELTLRIEPTEASVQVLHGPPGSERAVQVDAGASTLRIPTGPVTVRAEAIGYHDYERRLTLKATKLTHAVRMKAFDVVAGRRFRDPLLSGGQGPLLVVVPAGVFRMGSEHGSPDERPVRQVSVSEPFAIGVFEVTREDYERMSVEAIPQPDSEPQPDSADRLARQPMASVTWHQAAAYADWLSRETGQSYRLPSEAEWEYAARAGAETRYPFGDDPTQLCRFENIADRMLAQRYSEYETVDCSDGGVRLVAAGSYQPNAFGIHDMLGNVREWVADCWNRDHRNAPPNARARAGNCTMHVVRGGAWDSAATAATVSFRSFSAGANPLRGFRVARNL